MKADGTAPRTLWRNGAYGSCALVTGATDGIGREFARELAALGFDLYLVARRRDRLDALAAELREKHNTSSFVIDADLARAEDIKKVLAQTASVDIGLFVAAAGFGTSGPLLDQPLEAELDMIDVNCRAVVAMTSPIARRMAERKRGGIVLMSSLLAFQGVPRAANYAATKAFVQSLAEGLRTELRLHGIDVIACAPGPIASGFAARANMVMGLSQPATVVARTTLNALGRKMTVRPGWLSKFLELSLTPLPRRGRVLMLTRVMKGMARGAPPHERHVLVQR
jgi:uncharacterized protein